MLTPKKATEPLVLVFHNEVLYTFERTEESASVFGGPAIRLSGVECGPKPVQTLACLSPQHLPLPDEWGFDLPLVYGFCFSGCEMVYRVGDSSHGELLEMTPTISTNDWPYPDYPETFPTFPLTVSVRPVTYAEFAKKFPNLPDEATADLIALVPTPATMGVSLWGEGGDAEGVTVVFECDLKNKTVHAYNICS